MRFRALRFPAPALCLTLILIGLLTSAGHLQAQNNTLGDEGSRPIVGAGHNHIYGISETVSPSNGTVNLRINLPVPKDRGLTLPFAITYNSGSVHRFASAYAGCGGLEGGCANALVTDLTNPAGGWADTLPYASASVWVAISASPSPGPGITTSCAISSSYNFYDMSGASHPLGLAFIGPPITPSGGGASACQQIPYHFGNFYYGSSATGGDDEVTAQAEANCPGTASEPEDCKVGPSFTVTDLDGNAYFFPRYQAYIYSNGSGATPAYTAFLYPTKIEDRNGNVISFTIPTNGVGGGLPVVDSAGRQIIAASNSTGPLSHPSLGALPAGQDFTVPTPITYTVGGLPYQVAFTSASASYTSPSQFLDLFPDPGTCGAYFSIGKSGYVVHSISAPNGTNYTFGYDSQFGLVNEVDYPGGDG